MEVNHSLEGGGVMVSIQTENSNISQYLEKWMSSRAMSPYLLLPRVARKLMLAWIFSPTKNPPLNHPSPLCPTWDQASTWPLSSVTNTWSFPTPVPFMLYQKVTAHRGPVFSIWWESSTATSPGEPAVAFISMYHPVA